MKLKNNVKKGNFIKRWLVPTLIAGMFLCCLYALHDMQTAEGIGLYFTLQLELNNRIYLDVLVDVLCMLCLALLLWLPCLLLVRKKGASYCRLFIGYLAVVPTLSLSKVLHMFHGESSLLWESDLDTGIVQWFFDSVEGLRIWLPLLILLYALREWVIGDAQTNVCAEKLQKSIPFPKWHQVIWLVQGLLLIMSLLIPAIRHLSGYLVGYLGLLLAFDCWETILQENKTYEKWSRIVFAILLLRGIYRIMILVSQV